QAAHPGREIALTSTGDCKTSGDPERLLQLFSNIVANAVLHGATTASVAVSVVGTERDVVVRVRNDGAIPREPLATLVEPFRNRPRSAPSTGLGLGMYISRQIARAHGGDITVETAGDRTVVSVRLPRAAASSTALPRAV